jgi:hypothetical protein
LHQLFVQDSSKFTTFFLFVFFFKIETQFSFFSFHQTDEEFLKLCRAYRLVDGSTSAVALFVDNQIITAHAGDSRIVLCRDKKAIRLTEDHKPDRKPLSSSLSSSSVGFFC